MGEREGDDLKRYIYRLCEQTGSFYRQHKVYFRLKLLILLYHKVGADVIGEQRNIGSLSKEMDLRRDLKEEVAGAFHVRGYDEMFILDP